MRLRAPGLTAFLAVLLAGCSAVAQIPTQVPSTRIEYGSAPQQFGDLSVPGGLDDEERRPVVVLIHGGYWRAGELDLMEPLASDLNQRGYAVWNIEYRKVGEPGGGYPGTLEDVDAAIDMLEPLADDHPLDLERVSVIGHSAGGHLSLWAGTREDAEVVPTLVVGQAPVTDLAAAEAGGLDGRAVTDFMGGTPAEDPAAYAAASPAERLPGSVPQLIVQGGADAVVPEPYVAGYVVLARSAGATIEYIVDEDGNHFTPIDPSSELWEAVTERLPPAG